ncbi:alpha/beta hydrolase [Aureisphaera sp. CAU 1614]|uniref:Alpha/beta hydrolase n=1 Tax=Halomarinibacterium sedimenti TaxID=2857106 RepID=A0A9X1JUF4_9FLAO|nr:alpha/beta hydrolase-fold protein [Halomarinibacterium sedimenti]MBW2936784.1 alpha/beta hydrolase [Halomarinibacterium sedimenti]
MRTKIIKRLMPIAIMVLGYCQLNAQLANTIDMTEDGQLLGLGTQHIYKSKILDEDRPIIISLPIGYETSNANYPVLYVLDGLGNIKHTVATAELLAESGLISPLIIVGIQSMDRAKDLTPSKAGEGVYGGAGGAGIPQSGGAPLFLKFLEEELIPYVETTYRTHPFRILEGHSFGGLFSTFVLMQSPDLFDAFIIQAPALWWNNEEMIETAKTFYMANFSLNKTVYFGIGGDDGWGMRQELKRYVEVVNKNTPHGFRWKHEEVGDEDHNQARLLLNYHGLRFIFSDLKNTKFTIENFDRTTFLKDEQNLISQYGEMTRRPAMDYVKLYAGLDEKGETTDAIVVLKRATEAYPKYVGLLNNLAKLYEKVNQIQRAISTYEEAIKVSKKYKLGYEEGYQLEIDRLEKN